MQSAAAELNLPPGETVGLGIWIDGVPYNWDRSESLEGVAMNLPGLGGSKRSLRIPLCVVPSKCVLPGKTFDGIMEVVVWSLKQLALGVFPDRRHDDGPWLAEDKLRRRKRKQPLGIYGVLVEVRGDWKAYKDVFRLPGWNTLEGLCFLCTCTPADLRNVGSGAAWRGERRGAYGWILHQAAKGVLMNPLVGAPGMRLDVVVKIDWLHCCDLGVAQQVLGNILWACQAKVPGGTIKERYIVCLLS